MGLPSEVNSPSKVGSVAQWMEHQTLNTWMAARRGFEPDWCQNLCDTRRKQWGRPLHKTIFLILANWTRDVPRVGVLKRIYTTTGEILKRYWLKLRVFHSYARTRWGCVYKQHEFLVSTKIRCLPCAFVLWFVTEQLSWWQIHCTDFLCN